MNDFDRNVPCEVKALAKGRWQWRRMAEEVGLAHEHDYIYAYVSKLLQATPASITTDEKQLEQSERFLFLRYIRMKLLDAVEAANLAASG